MEIKIGTLNLCLGLQAKKELVKQTIKKAILYGKIYSNNANYLDIIKMSQINAPIHSYQNSQIYYQRPKIWQKKFGNFFSNFLINFFLANETRYINSDLISEQSKKVFLTFFLTFKTRIISSKLEKFSSATQP